MAPDFGSPPDPAPPLKSQMPPAPKKVEDKASAAERGLASPDMTWLELAWLALAWSGR
ncbi:MAG: hypothetical protein ACP5OS_01450 [Leptospirillia bacterium]